MKSSVRAKMAFDGHAPIHPFRHDQGGGEMSIASMIPLLKGLISFGLVFGGLMFAGWLEYIA